MGLDGEEGVEEEIARKLRDLHSYLEARIRQLGEEAERLKLLCRIVGDALVARSFQTADAVRAAPPRPAPRGEEIPLKTSSGLLLANLYVTEDEARIVPADGMAFKTETPPFQAFLVRRILESLRAGDQQAVRAGEMAPDKAFSYEIVADGDDLREIVVRNYGDQRRLREITRASHWTLEKMYDKVRTQLGPAERDRPSARAFSSTDSMT